MLYNIIEAAKELGVSPRQVRRYIKEGKLKAHLVDGKFGKEYQITEIPADLRRKTSAPSSNDALMGMLRDLQADNIRLASQLGVAMERARGLEERIKLLTAPKISFFKRLFRRT